MENQKEKIIVVTGGAGFVGSHLIERLLSLGHRVVSIDNYFNGSFENHIDNGNVTYFQAEASQIGSVMQQTLFDGCSIDKVFHLGEYSRVEQSFDDIDLVWQNNIEQIKPVVDFCKQHGAKLIYAGSSTKFADQTEGYIASPYAWTKAQNTSFIMNYHNWFGLDYAIAYFYNVYGPREKADGPYATVIAKFNKMVEEGKKLTVTAPGTQTRNFTHVNDIVDGLILIGEKGFGEYGIGNDIAYSIIDVAEMFNQEYIITEHKRGNRVSAPVLNHRLKELGWSCKHNLVQYIDELNKGRK